MKLIHLIFGVLITASFIYLSIIFWPQDLPPEKKYIIRWHSTETGVTGQGKTRFLKKEAEAIALKLNLEYGELLIHWAEKVPTKPKTCIVGQLFYDIENPKKPEIWICCEPNVWKITETDNETEMIVGIVKGIDTTEGNFWRNVEDFCDDINGTAEEVKP